MNEILAFFAFGFSNNCLILMPRPSKAKVAQREAQKNNVKNSENWQKKNGTDRNEDVMMTSEHDVTSPELVVEETQVKVKIEQDFTETSTSSNQNRKVNPKLFVPDDVGHQQGKVRFFGRLVKAPSLLSKAAERVRMDTMIAGAGYRDSHEFLSRAVTVYPKNDLKGIDAKLDETRREEKLTIYAKDKIKMSHGKYSGFRQILKLEKHLEPIKKISQTQSDINKELRKKLGLEKAYMKGELVGAKITNIEKMLLLMLESQEVPTTKMKQSGDGRQVRIGKVGHGLQPLDGSDVKAQSSDDFLPILVYDGKGNAHALQESAPELVEFFKKWSDGKEHLIGDKFPKLFFSNGDYMHMWHNGFIKEITKAATITQDTSPDLEATDYVDLLLLEGKAEAEKMPKTGVGCGGSITCRCIICGGTLNDIRRGVGLDQRVSLVNVFGIPIKGFCCLHCDVRVVEWLLLLSTRGKAKKLKVLSKILHENNLVRKNWDFEKEQGKYKPGQLFGPETEKILSFDVNLLFPGDIPSQELMTNYKQIKPVMNTKTAECVKSLDWPSVRELLKSFGKLLDDTHHNAGKTYYTHLLVDHLEEEMLDLARKYSLTLAQLSQQAIEKSNADYKNILKALTSPAASTYDLTEILQFLQATYRPKYFEWKKWVAKYRKKKRNFKNGVHKPYKNVNKKLKQKVIITHVPPLMEA